MIGRLLPIAVFLLLAMLLGAGLMISDHKTELPSPLIGKQIPEFTLPLLGQNETLISDRDLVGKPFLLNVWASWCSPLQGRAPGDRGIGEVRPPSGDRSQLQGSA
jgi:cytochrome c biogenesis protein CcmG/thiol:disulfide interchange protein DsbE